MKKFLISIVLSSIFLQTSVFAQKIPPIKIGIFVDLTGPTRMFGISTTNAIKLAADEINSTGGINGRKLELYIEDDQGRPEVAKTVVQKLVEETKVTAIIGDVASSNSLAAAPVAQAARIPMISPASTHPMVTEVGDYIFRACFLDPFQGEAMAKFAFSTLKARRVAIMGDINSDYSKGLAENFTATITKLGGKVVGKEGYTWNDPNFKGQLAKIRRLKPDALYIPGYFSQAGTIIKEARQMNMQIPILGGDGWDSPELWKLGGAALKNTYITNHFADDDPSPKVREFVGKYKTRFGRMPDALAALGYDTAYVLADALRRAESTDGDDLRRALVSTRDFSGVTGRISRFNPTRSAIKPVIIQKLNPQTASFIYNSTIQP